jgi:hypothetical protein
MSPPRKTAEVLDDRTRRRREWVPAGTWATGWCEAAAETNDPGGHTRCHGSAKVPVTKEHPEGIVYCSCKCHDNEVTH